MLKRIPLNCVHVLPGIFKKRMDLNEAYLMELDSTCLLQNFYLEAGIILPNQQSIPDPEKAKLHWGWEAPSCQLRGHFLGHWMSAAAELCANEKHPMLQAKLEYIVQELARCQKLNGGEWIGSIPEKYFALMRPGNYIWSPQYTMHKTIMGLKDVYDKLKINTAIEILDRLADWYIRWVESVQKDYPDAVFSGEQAGMLEVWADLYALTGNEKYSRLIDAYEGNAFFARLDTVEDALSDDHANASIPLSHGAGRMFEITGKKIWFDRMIAFWNTAVTNRGMFSSTGSNAGEFWIPPFQHSHFLCQTDQEFCTVYNMVRAAEYLYRWTGDTKYADYIERAIYNGFLAQQNKYTGMPTYFLPMLAGARKTWGSRTRDFWCCFGTMVQAQTIYPELIWYTDEEDICVSQYIPSETILDLNGSSVRISQNVFMKNYNNQVLFDEHSGGRVSRWSFRFKICVEPEKRFCLRFRIPGWCSETPQVSLNGQEADSISIRNGYLIIDRLWKTDTVDLYLPSNVYAEPLRETPELFSLLDGPIVLAGLTDHDIEINGDVCHPDSFLISETPHTYDSFVWQQNTYRTRYQSVNFRLVPLYEVTDEPYTVYFSEKRE